MQTSFRASLAGIIARSGIVAAILAHAAFAGTAQPLISFTNPPSANPGAAALTLKVYGSGFANNSQVQWKVGKSTTLLATTFMSGHELDATVPASLLASNGTPVVQVVTTKSSLTLVSNTSYFPISPQNSAFGYTQLPQAAGNGPSSIAVGDINNDGIPDVAIVNSQDNTLEILFGKGDGTFPNGTLSPVGTTPVFVVVGDFNNDGKLDVAIANQGDNSVYVLPGNGDGTFSTGQKLTFGTEIQPSYLAVGDFNNDGNLDLVVVFQNHVDVLYGDGDGTFAQNHYQFSGATFTAAAVADFNNDGNLDLALTAASGAIYIVLGNGAGGYTFLSPQVTSGVPEYLAVADFNGDGKADLVVTSSNSNELLVLLGNGDGTFSGENFGTGSALGVGVGDLDGDGRADFAIMDTANALNPFVGNGVGGFFLLSPIQLTAGQGAQVAVGDFNGDGILDLVVGAQAGSQFTVLLSGPVVNVSPSSLTFGSQDVGTTSAAQTVTITNTGFGPNPLNISSIAVTGDFAQTNNCSSLASTSTCTINITFSPTAGGTRTGTLTITDNSQNVAGSTQTVSLSGTAPPPVPMVGSLPGSLNFGDYPIGTTSPASSFPVNNSGTGPLTINSIATTGDYAQTNNCPSSLAPGAGCTVNVTFTPTTGGTRNGTVVLTDNSNNVPNSTQTVNLTGTGDTLPAANLSATSLTFANVTVGNKLTKSVTLSNSGTGASAALSISGVAVTGKFTQTNNCGSSLAAGNSCTIQVSFSPAAAGVRNGTLTITDNAGGKSGSMQTVSLMAEGERAGAEQAPYLYSAAPVSAHPGGKGFNLTIDGLGGSHLDWQVGASVTRLTASNNEFTIPASLLANPGTASLTLVNPRQKAPATGSSKPILFPIADRRPAAIFRKTALKATSPGSVVSADFNGDGYPDLAVAKGTAVAVLLGEGNGHFRAATKTPVSNSAIEMSWGDFNGDGKLDLAVVGINSVSILLGKGDGTFTAGQVLSIFRAGQIAVADFNLDGYLDLAVSGTGTSILLGNGDGTFSAFGSLSASGNLLVGDFGGPVGVDLLVAQGLQLITYEGDGDGTFSQDGETAPFSGALALLPAPAGSLVAVAGGTDVTILQPQGGGGYSVIAKVPVGRTSGPIVVGDFNNDGHEDLAVLGQGGKLSVLLGNSKGGFGIGTVASGVSSPFAVGDFDGDGRLDLAARSGRSLALFRQPSFEVSAGYLAFQYVNNGGPFPQKSITISNTGTQALTFKGVTVTGKQAVDFENNLTTTCGASIAVGGSCTITVTYMPQRIPGKSVAELVLSDGEGTQQIGLEGHSKQ